MHFMEVKSKEFIVIISDQFPGNYFFHCGTDKILRPSATERYDFIFLLKSDSLLAKWWNSVSKYFECLFRINLKLG